MAQGRSANNPLPHNLLFSDSRMGNLLTSVWIQWQAKHPNTLVLYGDKLLINSDRHTQAPADFNGISQTLTGQEMTMLPARATSVVQARRERAGYHRYDPFPSNAPADHYSRRHSRLSFARLARSLPGLMFLTFVAIGSFLIGFQRLIAWIQPAAQTSRKNSADFGAFEGKYRCQRKSEPYILTIKREGDRLYASSGKERSELIPVSKNEFRGNSGSGMFKGTFVFSRNATGMIVSVTSSGSDGLSVVCQRTQ